MGELIETKNIGRKFNKDGSVRFFPGNTIISKVKPDNAIYPLVCEISTAFQNADEGKKYGFLPFDSFHMTMIQGVCHEDRKEELWSRFLSLDLSLEKVDDFFEKKYREVKPLPETEMVFDYIDITNNIIIVRFLPKEEQDALNLKYFRDDVSEKLGLRFPDHDSYRFHISIAYQLWETEEEEGKEISRICNDLNERLKKEPPVFTLAQPEMTYFDNMYAFHSFRIERQR